MRIKRYATSKPFPFSDAVQGNGMVFLSGQVSMTEEGEHVYGSVTEQTQRIMLTIVETLKRTGISQDNVVKVQVWLSDMKYFAEFNAAYCTWFPNGYPARTVTTSRLAFELDVEIEVQAVAS